MYEVTTSDKSALTPKGRRRGAATIESAIVLVALLTVLFATLDLGLASFRRNAVHEATRALSRAAIVRGAGAEASGWGPTRFDGTVADATPYVAILQPSLATMPLDDVRLTMDWLDGDRSPGSRVRVGLSYEHRPIVPFFYGGGPILIHSTSTMRIVQ